MTVHVLDTGAVIHLLRTHNPKLESQLKAAAELKEVPGQSVWIPTPVLTEVGQARAPEKKRLERIMEYAEIAPTDRRQAELAAEALRGINRKKCEQCSGFVRPTLVDAIVMAFAARYADDDDTLVYTQDVDDFEALRAFLAKERLQLVRV